MVDENNMNIDMVDSYEKAGVDPFDAPTPGASLTNDPQNPYPWETPPDFTNQESALKNIFTNEEVNDIFSEMFQEKLSAISQYSNITN